MIATAGVRTIRFPYGWQPASSKMSLKDYAYERQSGRTAKVCAPTIQRIAIVFAMIFGIGCWNVSLYVYKS